MGWLLGAEKKPRSNKKASGNIEKYLTVGKQQKPNQVFGTDSIHSTSCGGGAKKRGGGSKTAEIIPRRSLGKVFQLRGWRLAKGAVFWVQHAVTKAGNKFKSG